MSTVHTCHPTDGLNIKLHPEVPEWGWREVRVVHTFQKGLAGEDFL